MGSTFELTDSVFKSPFASNEPQETSTAGQVLKSIGSSWKPIGSDMIAIDNINTVNPMMLEALAKKGYSIDVDPNGAAMIMKQGNWFQQNASWIKPTMDLANFGIGLFNTWQNYLNAKSARKYMNEQKNILKDQLRIAKEEWELRKKASGFSKEDLADAERKAKGV